MERIIIQFVLLQLIFVSCGTKADLREFNIGIEEFNKNNYEEALKIFKKGTLKNNGHKYPNFYGVAYCYYNINKYILARKEILKCLEGKKYMRDEFLSDVYLLYGLVESELGNKDKELESYKNACELYPRNIEALVTYGHSLNEIASFEEAIKVLNKAIEFESENSYAYNNRARAKLGLNQFVEAEEDIEEALRIDKRNPYIYLNKYELYKAKNQLQKACEMLEVAMELDFSEYGSKEDEVKYVNIFKSSCY